MIKTILTALVVSGALSLTAQAQTTPAGSRTAGTTATSGNKTSKAGQGNSGDMAPNRSSTAGTPSAATSNNPVDATGKPLGTTPSNSTSTVKTRKPKN